MKKVLSVLTVLTCLLLFGCGAAPKLRTIVNSFSIEADFETVWVAVIETFSDMQFPIDNMEKDSGLITTDWISFPDRYADCGKLGILDTALETNGKFNAFLKRVTENSCELRVNCSFQLTYTAYGSEREHRKGCVSTGEWEADFYKLILSKIDR